MQNLINLIIIFFSLNAYAVRYDLLPYDSDRYDISNIVLQNYKLKGKWHPVVIYGTLNSEKSISESLKNQFNKYTGLPLFITKWKSTNSDEAREKAIRDISVQIKEQFKSEQKLIILGHSHGGNIAVMVVNELIGKYNFNPNKIIVISIHTPVLDKYQLRNNIFKHLNFYNPYDIVQIRAGHDGDTSCAQGEGCAGRQFLTAVNFSYRDGLEDSYWKKSIITGEYVTQYYPANCTNRHCGLRDQNNYIWFSMMQDYLLKM